MSVKLFKKSLIAYKPIVLWNILVNLLIGIFFIIDGLEKPGPYAMIVFMKPIGWTFSLVIERFFLKKYTIFYKNMGLGFRKIFLNQIVCDVLEFRDPF
ncbi:hypothetical protein GJU39_18425 [Pedobacter petrophilus]|uniref:Uncharacterized protein n=1 Tax=Pedobacter petrophilus TaxID=1908241 RepID=A0A7K0G4A1_9SPHI|nr:hypothetical protein [Pedobacter petrophilus]MRX78059.1 hypothetical protein [Pedobacter petrophilus]